MEEWFKLKKYPHIGYPLKIRDYTWVKEYVTNPDSVKKHSFLPFIFKSIVKRKYRPDKSVLVRNPSGKKRRIVGKPKVRHIYYASHLDSLIYSYYNWNLNKLYEKYINNKPFESSILAYRKIPIEPNSLKNKCNIDFAKSAFDFIKNNNDKKLTVIVADITSFFDNLNHKILKKQWCKVLGLKALQSDHYNVFKSITNIRYVESSQIFSKLNNQVIVEKGKPNSNTEREYKILKVRKQKYFKEKNVVAYCSKKEFVKNHLDLIVNKRNTKGIPQGSPLSATLANIYMLDFDELLWSEVNAHKGLYLRYSDDLFIVCDQLHQDYFIELLRSKIDRLAKLEIGNDKTKVYRFQEIDGIFKGFQIDEKTKEPFLSRPLEYLGFSYDGQRVLIKTSGFSKFYRAMKRSFKKSVSLAKYSKNPDKVIFKGKLYKRFTYKGAKRKLIYRPSGTNKTKFVKTTKYYWGNYVSYLCKANATMLDFNGNESIKRQSRKFWRQFHKLMKTSESNVKLYHDQKNRKDLSDLGIEEYI